MRVGEMRLTPLELPITPCSDTLLTLVDRLVEHPKEYSTATHAFKA